MRITESEFAQIVRQTAENSTVTLKSGLNVISDYLVNNILLSPTSWGEFMIANFFAIPEYFTRKGTSEYERRKFWNEYIEGRSGFWNTLLKPEFLKDYQITLGTLKTGVVSGFDKSGALHAIGGGVLTDYIEFFNQERIMKIEEILGIKISSEKLKNFIEKRKAVELKDYITKRDTNMIDIGGWVPNPNTEKIIFEKKPNIVFRDGRNPNEPIDENKLNEIRKDAKKKPEDRPKNWKPTDWIIAKVDEREEILEILVRPQYYSSKFEQEERPPLRVDGALIIFTEYNGKLHFIQGGARSPASSTIPYSLNNPNMLDGKEKIKKATGQTENPSFVAAIEIVFKESRDIDYIYGRPPEPKHIAHARVVDALPL